MNHSSQDDLESIAEETRLHRSIQEVQEKLGAMDINDPVVKDLKWSLARVVSHEQSEQRIRVNHGNRLSMAEDALGDHSEILRGNPKTGALGLMTKVNIMWHAHIWVVGGIGTVIGYWVKTVFSP